MPAHLYPDLGKAGFAIIAGGSAFKK